MASESLNKWSSGLPTVIQVLALPSHAPSQTRLHDRCAAIWQVLSEGGRIACVVATVGTTDALGMDSVGDAREVLARLSKEFKLARPPHLHADCVVGWAWSVYVA